MAITKVINDAVDLNQTSDYSGLRLPVGTTGNVVESFTTDYLVIGGGGSGSLQGAGGAGGLRTSYNNSTTTTNSLNFPSGKTAIATYMLDNNATDISQNYDGAETNISYNTGQYGGAAIFNGSSSYIELPASVGQLNNYTFSAWFNTGSLGVIQCLYSYNNPSTPRSFIFLNSGGTNNIRVYSQNTNYYSSNNIYVANQWYHIAYTKSSTNGITVYLNNNVIINDSSATSNDIATTAGDNRLGGYKTSSPSSYFDGSIDQVRIFNTALSASDITTLARGAGTAYNGTWNGTEQYTPGRFGQAAKFTNDSTSWIDLLNTSTSVFSCSVWVKLDELGTTAQYIIGNSIEPSHPNDKNFNLYYRGDYNLNQFSFQSSEGYVGFGPTIQANQWYHVCWSGNNGTLTKVWVNGQEQSLPTVTRTFDSSGEWRVGVWRYRNSSNTLLSAHPLRGSVDQVRIFSTALLNNQVTDLYNEHYQTKFTDGSDTAIMFTQGTGTITFNGTTANAPQGAIRANTSYSEDGSSSVIEHYNGTEWKYFDAVKYCTTNTFNASGEFGAAAEFNGSSSIINNVLSGFTYDNKNITFSAWIKSSKTTMGNNVIIGQAISNADGGWGIATGYAAAQKLSFSIAKPGVQSVIGSVTMNTGNWQHIVVIVDFADIGSGGTSAVKMYVDGVEDTGLTGNLTQNFDESSYNTAIGGTYSGSNGRFFDGDIDQVRIFNTAISSAQVEDLYNNEIACS